ncbi:MAG: prepilin-type N-terminal cleavage/methylation domain-containing protein [Gemmatimonadaceae bacterium]
MRRVTKGFTLIELIIVMVVIGVLAGIAIARFANAKEMAYVATMKSDLRNFAIYEQNYAADNNGSYFSGDGVAAGFKHSPDVTVLATAATGPPATWSANAAHTRTPTTCSIGTGISPGADISCP